MAVIYLCLVMKYYYYKKNMVSISIKFNKYSLKFLNWAVVTALYKNKFVIKTKSAVPNTLRQHKILRNTIQSTNLHININCPKILCKKHAIYIQKHKLFIKKQSSNV